MKILKILSIVFIICLSVILSFLFLWLIYNYTVQILGIIALILLSILFIVLFLNIFF